MLRSACFAACVALAMGHGALYHPTPRNALDNVLPEYAGGKAPVQGSASTTNCQVAHRCLQPALAPTETEMATIWAATWETGRPPMDYPTAKHVSGALPSTITRRTSASLPPSLCLYQQYTAPSQTHQNCAKETDRPTFSWKLISSCSIWCPLLSQE